MYRQYDYLTIASTVVDIRNTSSVPTTTAVTSDLLPWRLAAHRTRSTTRSPRPDDSWGIRWLTTSMERNQKVSDALTSRSWTANGQGERWKWTRLEIVLLIVNVYICYWYHQFHVVVKSFNEFEICGNQGRLSLLEAWRQIIPSPCFLPYSFLSSHLLSFPISSPPP